TKRMSDHWQMMASYVWSRLDGDFILDPTNPNNLIDSVRTGRGPTTGVGTSTSSYDQPHAFKLLGSYQAPWGINLGANFQALSGLPRDRTLNVALTQGTTAFRVEPRGAYRYDFLKLLSVRADKRVKLRTTAISVVGEVHNVLNQAANQNSVGA